MSGLTQIMGDSGHNCNCNWTKVIGKIARRQSPLSVWSALNGWSGVNPLFRHNSLEKLCEWYAMMSPFTTIILLHIMIYIISILTICLAIDKKILPNWIKVQHYIFINKTHLPINMLSYFKWATNNVQMTLANTLEDNKIQGIQFLDLAQRGLIHGSKYWQILIFQFNYIKQSLKDLWKSSDELNFN